MFLNLILLLSGLSAALGVSGNWTGVASDSTGQYLTASSSKSGSYYGHVFTSDDYGATWISKAPALPWSGIASDSTGKLLFAEDTCTTSSACNGPFMSTDRGDTWVSATKPPQKDNYYAASSDSTGSKLVTAGGEGVWHSSDGGASWFRFNLDQGYNGNVAAISGDGKTYLLDYMEYLTVTTDGGKSWKTLKVPEARWRGMSVDYSGKILTGAYDQAYGSGGNYDSAWYLSTDGGATVTAVKDVNDGEKFYSVSANADGTYVFCGGSSGIYVYNVATKQVTKSTAPANGYYSIASSKTGKYVLAASGSLWLSSDYGTTFTQVA
jgi:photosystem II stability/assembly factor-like uncharacterized protein